MAKKPLDKEGASCVSYGGEKMPVLSYAHSRALRMPGIERNHTVPKVFFTKGPLETRKCGEYVPIMPLTQEEHRGSGSSFHHMKDRERKDENGNVFHGCGLDDYLRSCGLQVRGASSYTASEVSRAIDACRDYHKMIGLDFLADAIESFRRRYYDPIYAD